MGLAMAALAQMGPGGDPSAMALVAEDSSDGAEAAPTTAAAETTSTAPTPFTYRMAVLSGVSTDNFWAFYGEQASVWNSYILGPTKPALYKIDPVDGSLTPELARETELPTFDDERWSVRIDLNESLAWSDGTPITAEDFVFTFETVRNLELGGSWAAAFPDSVLDVRVEPPNALRIEFSERPTFAVWPHAVGTAPVMASHVWESAIGGKDSAELYEMAGASDVGGGPLALLDVEAGVVRSVANPGYPMQQAPDVVEYHIYEDEQAAVAALDQGEVDAILTSKGLTAEHQASIEANPSIALETNPANGVRYLGFNLRRLPMGDQAFRTALALLLDRRGLAEKLAEGSEVPHSFVRGANALWYDEETALSMSEMYSGDLESRISEAVSGLRDAGYAWVSEPSLEADGSLRPGTGLTIRGSQPAPLTILTPGDTYDPARPEYVEAIAETLGVLGFDVRPVVTDFDTVVDLAFTQHDGGPQYDMYLLGWTLGNPALPDYYRPLFASDGVMNNTGYASPAFDQQLEAYEEAYTLQEARNHLWAMEQTLAADLPYLLLYTTEITEAYRLDRVSYDIAGNIGGIQGRLGGIGDVKPFS